MSESTAIEWCDSTFNPWLGCTKVGPGCDNCYAEKSTPARSQGVVWGPNAERRRTSAGNWNLPLRWNRQHDAFYARHGRRRRVFCASLADVFDNAVPPSWRADLFDLIEQTPNLDWLLVTKRIGNVAPMLVEVACSLFWMDHLDKPRELPNVWLGITVVNQAEADRDIPKLLATPARVRFLSMEPLLGPVNLHAHLWKCCGCPDPGHGGDGFMQPPDGPTCCGHPDPADVIDWVIAGGESGPNARPMHPDWVRSLRDQCAAAGVPFLFKQWGEWVPYEHSAQPPFLWSQHGHEIDGHALPDFESEDGRDQREWHCDWAEQILARRVGKKAAGRLLDGQQHDGFPGGACL